MLGFVVMYMSYDMSSYVGMDLLTCGMMFSCVTIGLPCDMLGWSSVYHVAMDFSCDMLSFVDMG